MFSFFLFRGRVGERFLDKLWRDAFSCMCWAIDVRNCFRNSPSLLLSEAFFCRILSWTSVNFQSRSPNCSSCSRMTQFRQIKFIVGSANGSPDLFLRDGRPLPRRTDKADDRFYSKWSRVSIQSQLLRTFPMLLTVTLNKLTSWALKVFDPFGTLPTLTWKAPHKIKLQSKQIDTKRRSWVDEVEPPGVGAPSKSPIIRNAIFVSVILR